MQPYTLPRLLVSHSINIFWAWAFEGKIHKAKGTGLNLPTGRQLQCLLATVTQILFAHALKWTWGSESGLTSLIPKLVSSTYSIACSSDIQGSSPPSWEASAPALPLLSACYWVSFSHLPGLNLSIITQASLWSHLMQSRRIILISLSLANVKMWTLESLVPSYFPGLGDSHFSSNIGGRS